MTGTIATALRAAAAGLHHSEAGTGLLVSHGGLLHRDDFTQFVHTATSISDGTTLLAWTDWDAVIAALDSGQLPASGGFSELKMIINIRCSRVAFRRREGSQ